MGVGRITLGAVVSAVGLGLFFWETGVGFNGPQLPETALGALGWLLVLLGLGLAKLGVRP